MVARFTTTGAQKTGGTSGNFGGADCRIQKGGHGSGSSRSRGGGAHPDKRSRRHTLNSFEKDGDP